MPAPAGTVRALLVDLRRWPAWDPYIETIELLSGPGNADYDPWLPGRHYRERVRRGPFRPTFQVTVVPAEHEGFAWTARFLGVRARHDWLLHEHRMGCAVESIERFEGAAPLLLAARLLFRVFRVEAMTRCSLDALAQAASAADDLAAAGP